MASIPSWVFCLGWFGSCFWVNFPYSRHWVSVAQDNDEEEKGVDEDEDNESAAVETEKRMVKARTWHGTAAALEQTTEPPGNGFSSAHKVRR